MRYIINFFKYLYRKCCNRYENNNEIAVSIDEEWRIILNEQCDDFELVVMN